MQHGQFGGFLPGRVRDIAPLAHDDGVAAGGFLHMEPQVLAAGGVQRELVVLQVVAADQNLEAVAGTVAQEIGRFLALVALLVVFEIALALELGADLVERLLAGGGVDLIEHGREILDLSLAFYQQLLQHGVGGLLLFVVLEILLRVFVGAKARVQPDGDRLAGVVIFHRGLAVALFQRPEVGLQQLAVQAQGVGLFALGQFFAAGGLLAHSAVVQVVHGLIQFAAFLAQALGAVFGGVVVLQQFAVGQVARQPGGGAVLLRGKEAELGRLERAVRLGQAHGGGVAARGVLRLKGFERGGQRPALVFVQIAGGAGGIAAKGAPHGLAQYDRPHAADRLAQRFGDRQVAFAGGLRERGGADGEEIRLVRLGRQRIGKAGQQLADLAVLKIDALERVDDAAVLDEHQVGVAAHEFRRQRVGDKVAHLVGAAEIKKDDAVAGFHAQADQTAAGQVLAQQHAETGRGERVFKALLR